MLGFLIRLCEKKSRKGLFVTNSIYMSQEKNKTKKTNQKFFKPQKLLSRLWTKPDVFWSRHWSGIIVDWPRCVLGQILVWHSCGLKQICFGSDCGLKETFWRTKFVFSPKFLLDKTKLNKQLNYSLLSPKKKKKQQLKQEIFLYF